MAGVIKGLMKRGNKVKTKRMNTNNQRREHKKAAKTKEALLFLQQYPDSHQSQANG